MTHVTHVTSLIVDYSTLPSEFAFVDFSLFFTALKLHHRCFMPSYILENRIYNHTGTHHLANHQLLSSDSCSDSVQTFAIGIRTIFYKVISRQRINPEFLENPAV